MVGEARVRPKAELGKDGQSWNTRPVCGRGMFGGIGKGRAGLGEDGWCQGEVGGLVFKGSTFEGAIRDGVF